MSIREKTTRRHVVLPAAIALLGLSSGAMAQGIEEITVTATKREATIQDVPFSINAQTAADIQRTGATNLEELSRNVAGLTVQNLGPGQSMVAIRGVSAGQIVRDQPGVKEQVGVYLDESVISLSLFTPDFDFKAASTASAVVSTARAVPVERVTECSFPVQLPSAF